MGFSSGASQNCLIGTRPCLWFMLQPSILINFNQCILRYVKHRRSSVQYLKIEYAKIEHCGYTSNLCVNAI